MINFKNKIRDIPDFPRKGIVFKDISPLLGDKKFFKMAVCRLSNCFKERNIDKVVGIDARGFIFAGAVAIKLNAGVVMARKKGKLPFETEEEEYALEYGKAILEIQKDAILPGEKVLIVDDVLATGGTMQAAIKIVEKLKGKVSGIIFLVALDFLGGKEKLNGYNIVSLIDY